MQSTTQSKGRVERAFGTAQDRLVKEMRIAGIDTLNAANRYPEAHWTPFWNTRFAVEPTERHDAHRPLPRDADLDGVFAETADRVIARDFTIRFANRRWQIPEQEAQGLRPGTKVVVEQRLNGELRFRTGDRYLAVLSLPRPARRARRKPPEHQRPSKVQTLRPASTTPTRDDHPWVTHHADPDTTIAGRARHRNGPSGKRNGKAPAPADLNSAASR